MYYLAIMRGLNLTVFAIGLLCIESTIAPTDAALFSSIKNNWFSRLRPSYVFTEKILLKLTMIQSLP
jgi:hypothetical protein